MKIEKIKADFIFLNKTVNTSNMITQSGTLPYIDQYESLFLGMCVVVLCITNASLSARTNTTASTLDLMPKSV